jgi:SAM-dependent methyltransferase
MLRRHATVAPVGGGGAVGAAGEALPFRAALFDLVVFGYSLHHVPVDRRRTALAEARRVLRPCGNVLVVEPVADDPDTLVAHPAVDERVELEQVQEMLGRSFRSGLVVESSTEFESVAVYADFESWCRLIVGIDPHRAALVDRHRERLRSQFHELGRRTSQGWGFERRSRLAVLRPV